MSMGMLPIIVSIGLIILISFAFINISDYMSDILVPLDNTTSPNNTTSEANNVSSGVFDDAMNIIPIFLIIIMMVTAMLFVLNLSGGLLHTRYMLPIFVATKKTMTALDDVMSIIPVVLVLLVMMAVIAMVYSFARDSSRDDYTPSTPMTYSSIETPYTPPAEPIEEKKVVSRYSTRLEKLREWDKK